MAHIHWPALWLRIYCASLLVWDFLVTVFLGLLNQLRNVKRSGVDLPLPAASSLRRPSDAKLAFPFPALRKDSRHSTEFQGMTFYWEFRGS